MAEHVKLCLVAEKHQRNAYTSTNNIYVLTHSLDLSKATFSQWMKVGANYETSFIGHGSLTLPRMTTEISTFGAL